MSDNIIVHRSKKYAAGIDSLSQQRFTRFRPIVRVETDVNAKVTFYDQMGSIEMTKKTGRHTPTPAVEMPHKRRSVRTAAYEVAALVDEVDLTTVMNDPTNVYGQTMASAAGRKFDQLIVAAATADALTGEDGDVVTPLGSGQIVDDASIFTFENTLKVKRILDENEIDEMRPRHAMMKAKQYEEMMNIDQFTSMDYNTQQALASGELKTFLRFTWGQSEQIARDSGDTADVCLFYAMDAILLAVATDVTARVDERTDLSYDTQVYYKMVAGATRMEEEALVAYHCHD